MEGVLYIVGTPLVHGNEISNEAIEILKKIHIIAAENLSSNKIRIEKIVGPLDKMWIPYFDGNELTQSMKIIGHLKQGKSVALISSAGMPLVCDPGYKLVQNCYKHNLSVVPIGGPCSVIMALVASGLPPFPFTFWGFFNNKIQISQLPLHTHIFFESSHRILKTLQLFNGETQWQVVLIKDINTIYYERIVVHNDTAINPKGQWVMVVGPKKNL
jgi:16S rRNA (cytidine1402-2'-O)-methyltransferase